MSFLVNFISAARAEDTKESGPPADLFEPPRVASIRLEVSEKSIEALRENPKIYVRATLKEGERTFPNIGLRLKGSVGSFQPLEAKPGLTIKMNQFVAEARFHGLRKFLLNNAAQDPSYLSEYLGNGLFAAALVPAARVGFARVHLNDRDLGLYVLVEGISRDFLSRHFLDPGGNLYEGPGEVSDELDTDSRGGQSDRSDLRALHQAAQDPDPKERLSRLEKVLDLDRFLSFLAVELMTWHWDGYAIGVNNYRIYDDPSSGRMTFLPHGSDQLFQNSHAELLPEIRGLVARAVLNTDEGRRRYRERIQILLDQAFTLKNIRRRADAALAAIQPVLKEIGEEAAKEHQETARNFFAQIAERLDDVREQVKKEFPPPPAPPAPLEFNEQGIAKLSGWQKRISLPGSLELDQPADQGLGGKPALHIAAGEGEGGAASWRARVSLTTGRYRFCGQVRTEGVVRSEEEGRPGGAGLRISGHHPARKVTGSQGWKRFEFEFKVPMDDAEEDSQDNAEVELVCELNAARGQVWFDLESLQLERL
ncbi:MAG: CotH kinase family protein [Planctomycetes bacterium]|nr:CotH kinase family protein [Planctomycetota bacterium]